MMSVLIIDDEINIIKSFRSLLGNEYEVFEARSGEAALECIAAIRIDFVFLDYNLGGENVFKELGLLLDKKVSVLITGENGTGKEFVAKALHYSGSEQEEPFVVVN